MSRLRMQAAMPRQLTGFGLIELMIAMVLGLIVLGAAIAVFQSNQRSYSANEGQNRVQENARAAYELVTRDIRATGGSACSAESLVLGSDASSTAFRAPLSGNASELTTVSADDASYRVKGDDPATTAAAVKLVETTPVASDIFKAGDIVMVCNAAMTAFVEVASVAGQVITFTATLPFDPRDTTNADPASISIARLRSNRWFTQANGRDTASSLYVSRSGNVGEVADGVQSLAVTYHQASGGDPTAYVAAPSDMQRVDGVRISMPVRAVMPTQNPSETRTVDRAITTVAAIRSRAP
jgi:type IV pilus assembly protein PilW